MHKIACNHLISKDMSLVPLASSETAWCWFAVDHSEGCPPEGRHDQLAVRSVGLLMKYVLKYQSLTNQLGQKKKENALCTEDALYEVTTDNISPPMAINY